MAAFIQVEKGELGREGEEFAADVAKFAMLLVVQFPARLLCSMLKQGDARWPTICYTNTFDICKKKAGALVYFIPVLPMGETVESTSYKIDRLQGQLLIVTLLLIPKPLFID